MFFVLDGRSFGRDVKGTFVLAHAFAQATGDEGSQDSYQEPTKEQPKSYPCYHPVCEPEAIGDVVVTGVVCRAVVVLGASWGHEGRVAASAKAQEPGSDLGAVDADCEGKVPVHRGVAIDLGEGIVRGDGYLTSGELGGGGEVGQVEGHNHPGAVAKNHLHKRRGKRSRNCDAYNALNIKNLTLIA